MEKSIESIWKEGFLESNALVAPKLNDLYNQKSKHIVDKFKRMYKINIRAIVVFAIILLPISFITDMPYMGIPMFVLFNVLVIISRKFKNKLDKIDTSLNSYLYLRSFNDWITEMVTFNSRMSHYLYPCMFLSLIAGFWFGGFGGNVPGQDFVSELLISYPNTSMLFGLPVIGLLGVVLVVVILAFLGGRIGKWDINLVYLGIFNKVNEILRDMEELRSVPSNIASK